MPIITILPKPVRVSSDRTAWTVRNYFGRKSSIGTPLPVPISSLRGRFEKLFFDRVEALSPEGLLQPHPLNQAATEEEIIEILGGRMKVVVTLRDVYSSLRVAERGAMDLVSKRYLFFVENDDDSLSLIDAFFFRTGWNIDVNPISHSRKWGAGCIVVSRVSPEH